MYVVVVVQLDDIDQAVSRVRAPAMPCAGIMCSSRVQQQYQHPPMRWLVMAARSRLSWESNHIANTSCIVSRKKKKTTTKTESIAWHTDHASPRRRKRKKNESVDANEFKPSLAMRTSRETVRQHKHDARTQIVDVKPRYLAYSIGTIQCLSYNRVHDHNRFWFVATIEKVGSAVRTTGMSPGMTPRGAAKHHMQQAALSPVATARLLGDQKHTQFVCVDRKEHLPRQNTKENI